jgi:hypothetical protein
MSGQLRPLRLLEVMPCFYVFLVTKDGLALG